MEYKFLEGINSPDDLKKIEYENIDGLCQEIRDCIIDTVSKNGGHLASNLGAVELTVALHRVFSSPNDAIVFDVGHQSYTHKLLTGRFKDFSTLRCENGISGFMRPKESEHDFFVSGHSSNSISAAYGLYRAKRLSGESGTAVAVIGDGALTGGIAYEALNNAGSGRNNFLVVLNDNKMSISRNVGALSRSLTKMRNRPRYHNFKFAISGFIEKIPLIGKPVYKVLYKIKEFIKVMIYGNNIFTSLGFNYLGPVDGHNVAAMESIFRISQKYSRPCVVHVITTKGKGYSYAENSPKNYHGVSPFDIAKGKCEENAVTFSDIAGQTLCNLAKENEKICAVTAAMPSGTGLTDFSTMYKSRFFDVGIAEQHAVTFCAGLAKGGMIPYFAVYSSFLQRSYDQILHDAAIAGLPVKLLIDRAGIVGEDGESHQGVFDTAYLTNIPNITVYSPSFYDELRYRIKASSENNELCAIRYPKGCENLNFDGEISGDYTLVNESDDKNSLLITYGRLFSNAVDALKINKNITVLKLNKIYPVSDKTVDISLNYKNVHFYEEGIKSGGIAEHFGSMLTEKNFKGNYRIYAIGNEFVPQAKITSALKRYSLDAESMANGFNA